MVLSEIGICSWLSRGHNSLFCCFDPQFDPLGRRGDGGGGAAAAAAAPPVSSRAA